jgi:DNA end-binding protein Ku
VKAFPPPRNVVNLFEAFRQSLGESERELKAEAEAKAAEKPAAAKAPKPKKAKPRVEGQRELLLPIAGKKGEEKKPASVSTPRRKAG